MAFHPLFLRRTPHSLHHFPRKALRRLLLNLAAVCLLLLLLLTLLRRHRRQKAWPAITPTRPLSSLPAIPRNIYGLPRAPVLYCYIPKNACSRFKALFRKRAGFPDWEDPALIHGRHNGLPRLAALQPREAMSQLASPDIRKFVVVRDPFARLVSAYQNKIAYPWPNQRRDFWGKHLTEECPHMMAERVMPEAGPLLSLHDFLVCLLTDDNLTPSNEHWRPQTDLCALDHIKYDVYLHLESLQDDADALLTVLGWNEDTASFEMNRKPVYSKPLSDFYSPTTIKLALQYYKTDFDILKYPRVPKGLIHFYSVFNGTNIQPGFEPPL